MSLMFDKYRSVISRHIKHLFVEKELDAKSNVHFLHITNSKKRVPFYSLDATISLQYHLKSQKTIYVIANSFGELEDNRNAKTCILYGEKDKLVNKDSIFTSLVHHNDSLIVMKAAFLML